MYITLNGFVWSANFFALQAKQARFTHLCPDEKHTTIISVLALVLDLQMYCSVLHGRPFPGPSQPLPLLRCPGPAATRLLVAEPPAHLGYTGSVSNSIPVVHGYQPSKLGVGGSA